MIKKLIAGFAASPIHCTVTYSAETKRWYLFCQPRLIDLLNPTPQDILEHLAEESHRDAAKSRTTLNWILPRKYSKMLFDLDCTHLCSKRIYREITLQKSSPLGDFVWDPQMVINYYNSLPADYQFPLMQLSEKAVILLLLATGKRPNEIRSMSLDSYTKNEREFVFTLKHHTKTSRWNKLIDRQITIRRFQKVNTKVCPYTTLEQYIKCTRYHRKSEYLFVTTTQGELISRGTMARWTKSAMTAAGIDTSFFTPYSTRSAAASSAARRTRSLDLVLKMGNWHSTGCFFNHYLRRVKYFSRDKFHMTSSTHDKNVVTSRLNPHIPADPARVRASHSLLRRAHKFRRLRKKQKTPYVDFPSKHQGLDDPSTSVATNYLEVSDAPSEAPSSPTPSVTSTISSVSDCQPPHLECFDHGDAPLPPRHRPNILRKPTTKRKSSKISVAPPPVPTKPAVHTCTVSSFVTPVDVTHRETSCFTMRPSQHDPFECCKSVFEDAPIVHPPLLTMPPQQTLAFIPTYYRTFLCLL